MSRGEGVASGMRCHQTTAMPSSALKWARKLEQAVGTYECVCGAAFTHVVGT